MVEIKGLEAKVRFQKKWMGEDYGAAAGILVCFQRVVDIWSSSLCILTQHGELRFLNDFSF